MPKTIKELEAMKESGELYDYIGYLEEVHLDYLQLKEAIKNLTEVIKTLY